MRSGGRVAGTGYGDTVFEMSSRSPFLASSTMSGMRSVAVILTWRLLLKLQASYFNLGGRLKSVPLSGSLTRSVLPLLVLWCVMPKCRENRRRRLKLARCLRARLNPKRVRLTDRSIDAALNQVRNMLTKEQWNESVIKMRKTFKELECES